MTHHAPHHLAKVRPNPVDAAKIGKRKLAVIICALIVLGIARVAFSHYAIVETWLDTMDHAALIGEMAFIFEG